MSEIIISGGEDEKQELLYKATERDEQNFFLLYNMNIQPSEAAALSDDYRIWLISRFIAQKQAEQEMIERHRLMSQIGGDLRS